MSERYKVGQVLILQDDYEPSTAYRITGVGEKIELEYLCKYGWRNDGQWSRASLESFDAYEKVV